MYKKQNEELAIKNILNAIQNPEIKERLVQMMGPEIIQNYYVSITSNIINLIISKLETLGIKDTLTILENPEIKEKLGDDSINIYYDIIAFHIKIILLQAKLTRTKQLDKITIRKLLDTLENSETKERLNENSEPEFIPNCYETISQHTKTIAAMTLVQQTQQLDALTIRNMLDTLKNPETKERLGSNFQDISYKAITSYTKHAITLITSNQQLDNLTIENILDALANPEIKEKLNPESISSYYDIIASYIKKIATLTEFQQNQQLDEQTIRIILDTIENIEIKERLDKQILEKCYNIIISHITYQEPKSVLTPHKNQL